MFMRRKIMRDLALCGVGALAMYMFTGYFSGTQEAKRDQMKNISVTSTDFENGTRMPDKYAYQKDNVSPQLAWDNVPAGTKSIALICDDPDALSVAKKVWVHWVMFNLPADTQELASGVAKDKELANGVLQGVNDFDQIGFDGPWPPEGHGDHHYHFNVYALDAMLDLQAGATKKDLEAAMKGHILAQGELIGVYSR